MPHPTTVHRVPGNVRGACPSVHESFVEPDGMLLRLRLPGGLLPAPAARQVGMVMAEARAGTIELTNRANLQLRGIPAPAVAMVRDAVIDAGLAPHDPESDARRNVLASPTAGIDAGELVDTRPVVAAITERLATTSPDVPHSPKFGVVVDAGGDVGLRGRALDLAFGAVRTIGGELRYEVRIAEALPAMYSPGERIWSAEPAVLIDVLDAVVDACRPVGRARDLIATKGEPQVWRDLEACIGGGLERCDRYELVPPRPSTDRVVGVHPQRQPAMVYVGALALLGRVTPDDLIALSDLAEGRTLRVSSSRSLVVPDVPEFDASRIVASCERLDMVCDPTHPGVGVVSCIGRNGCASGHVDALTDARALVARLAAVSPDRRPRSVHVSGCEKGCASSGPDEVSLIGGPGDGRYTVYRSRAGCPLRFGEAVADDLDPREAIDTVVNTCAPA
jgi:precorrin-3B synthase